MATSTATDFTSLRQPDPLGRLRQHAGFQRVQHHPPPRRGRDGSGRNRSWGVKAAASANRHVSWALITDPPEEPDVLSSLNRPACAFIAIRCSTDANRTGTPSISTWVASSHRSSNGNGSRTKTSTWRVEPSGSPSPRMSMPLSWIHPSRILSSAKSSARTGTVGRKPPGRAYPVPW